jgi:hypothetical protein
VNDEFERRNSTVLMYCPRKFTKLSVTIGQGSHPEPQELDAQLRRSVSQAFGVRRAEGIEDEQ